MNRQRLRSLHRWIFIFMGVFMLAWLVSGILMILPQQWSGSVTRYDQTDVDYSMAGISPAQAGTLAAMQNESETGAVKSVSLRNTDGHILYQVAFENGAKTLIDAHSGEVFVFTAGLAEEFARRNFGIEAPALEKTLLKRHDATYPFGPLPVYRVRFENEPEIAYFVYENNKVYRSSPLSRFRSAIVSLHEFGPIEYFTGSNALRYNLLTVTGVISLVGAIIGMLLILPRRKQGRRQAANTPNRQ